MPSRRLRLLGFGLLLIPAAVALCCQSSGGGAGANAKAEALNRRCLECHTDFEKEELSKTHRKKGIGCVRCHGASQAHADDETGATKPDATFRTSTIRVFCLTCHSPAEHRKESQHRAEDAKPNPADRRTCTGCHGEHVITNRDALKKG